jgi:hypothetical protein
MRARLADDHRDLGFEVEVRRFLRPHDRLLVADLRLGDADENRRLLGVVAPGLDNVVLVVEADAEDLPRIGDDRQPGDLGSLEVGLRFFSLAVVGDEAQQVRVASLQPGAEIVTLLPSTMP